MSMNREVEHSPLPWHVRPMRGLPDEDWWSILTADESMEVAIMPQMESRNKTDADLIVKAVNNHEALLAALRDLYNAVDSAIELTPQVLLSTRAVLERVEGE